MEVSTLVHSFGSKQACSCRFARVIGKFCAQVSMIHMGGSAGQSTSEVHDSPWQSMVPKGTQGNPFGVASRKIFGRSDPDYNHNSSIEASRAPGPIR
eukprot:jgi/Mesen1/6757/ME000344S06042